MNRIDNILAFKLYGKFAHFRKFYTNASSLSYLVPPRTVIIGIFGSILKLPRDSYYEIFSEDSCKVSVAVAAGTIIKKSTQSINMLHETYYRCLSTGKGNIKSIHTQCKLELLFSGYGRSLTYIIFVSMNRDDKHYQQLIESIKNNAPGYGIYLGQRQFRGNIEYIKLYKDKDIRFRDEVETLDSICLQENVIEFLEEDDVNIVIEQIPIHMKKETTAGKQPGREPVSIKRVLFEKNGKRLHGRFKNCWQVKDKTISFY